jgi:hypothetical protein
MNRPASGTYYEFVFDIYNRRVSTWGVGAASPTQALIYSSPLGSTRATRSSPGRTKTSGAMRNAHMIGNVPW